MSKAAGRPVQEVAAPITRALQAVRKREEKAREVLEGIWAERDEAIANAYASGVNKNRIATLVGVSVKTVDTSLERTGAI